ncbi:hypothetical protein O0I10_007272 [Lichtheimia ornata]|uniref:BZIP domain-containing protein n=1 Tax=Lichtheimia ornata TaxID=688661 RepID=A0AAD7V1I4_9FUNG|nr:uncharacterized protein O0I10_007272 [Lichtheimia ornata]KAJ8656938.1 hypothetical protein O0I10_007272 [Lichtheimia ornata]
MSPVNSFLDPLIFDLPTSSGSGPVDHTKLLEELDLWTNAQFTFDMQPGTAVQDKPTTTTPSLPLENEHDLWKFLSLDPTQHQQQSSSTTSPSSSSLSSSPITTSTMPVPQPTTVSPRVHTSTTTHPKILPKSIPQKRDRTEEEKSIEEDKRRRNTAASARFRAKKKLREQAMEQAVKEMSEKSEKLEERVKDLEHEIKWLRSLLIDKDTISSSSPSSL